MLHTADLRRYLGSVDPIPTTFGGLTPAIWLATAALCLALVGDVATTGMFIVSGNGWEGNPLAALTLHGGILGLATLKLFTIIVLYGLSYLLSLDGHPLYMRRYCLVLYVFVAAFVVTCVSNLMATFLGEDLYHFLYYICLYH